MEISRSPLASGGYPAATTRNTGTGRATVVEQAAPASSRARGSEPGGRVMQGELLQRERTHYQSTRAFLDERAFDRAQFTGQAPAAPRARAAISLYSNTAARGLADTAGVQGRSVNFFV